jgi:hypothetical protein
VQKVVWTAILREWSAESAENAAIAADSELAFGVAICRKCRQSRLCRQCRDGFWRLAAVVRDSSLLE